MVGKREYSVGQLMEGGMIEYNKSQKMWQERKVYSQAVCRECKYALFCGGSCPSHALKEEGDLRGAKCDSFQNMFNEAIYYAYQQAYKK